MACKVPVNGMNGRDASHPADANLVDAEWTRSSEASDPMYAQPPLRPATSVAARSRTVASRSRSELTPAGSGCAPAAERGLDLFVALLA